jgi:deazaflavin-dependent oxidoreductase (nitroreductase family)
MSSFPDVRWGSDTSPLRRPGIWLVGTRPGSWLVKRITPLDRRILIRSRGRYTALGPIGAPLLLLTTTGARSGQPRTTPLAYVRDGDDLIVVGSNFGGENHPAWSGNLLAHPEGVVTIGGQPVQVVAQLMTGADAAAAYRKMIDLADTYDKYRSRTDRDIRVFRLIAI